ncbi:MAG TPA: 2-oxo-4-hydroxy-4-carboxy-5-ureidoimidazoline decarboxylase [Steroidobacteraceae bacterium]|nr:2-oxo-4-hydroxy-4-carboxy-5-ureidoimidazoline decarboxylase [Steroidobacteraceae bacterium]
MSAREFAAALGAIFEHSPWVAERAAALRPFRSCLSLHKAMSEAVLQAEEALQLALIRAHPQLAGRAALRGELTPASRSEQQGAGLSALTQAQLLRLQSLNAQYADRFGLPFVLAVRGHTPESVIAALAERVTHAAHEERGVALREICRIAHFRLADLVHEPLGDAIIGMADDLAALSETSGALTCSYLTPTHRATAARIRDFMLAAGLAAHIDAVGNVVGVLEGGPRPKRVLTGSHYDTVIDAGKYDGRLGILLPIAVAGWLRRSGSSLPYTLEVIAFAEEEGVRFKSTFLGSRAVAGRFDPAALDSLDAGGTRLSDAIRAAGHDVAAIPAIARDPAQVACFLEVHIEQGPVLLHAALPVGVVTRIAGSVRSMVTIEGRSGHAGTVPMALRHDAAAAAAEMVLAVERRCREQAGLVGTVGRLEVPGGAINVIPGRCEFSIDIRSESDAVREAAAADVRAAIRDIAARRGVEVKEQRILQTASVPCAAGLQERWAASIERVTGGPALRLPSGAGHDAMMMASLTEVGMLFVRCGNGGISHHPDESLGAPDADIAARVFKDFLLHFEAPA